MLNYLTSHTGIHVAHHVGELLFFDTGWAQIGTPTAYGLFGFCVRASQFAGRTNVDTTPAQPAVLRFDIERRANAAVLAPAAEADGLGNHLFLTHPDTTPAQDAIFVFLFESLLPYFVFGGQVLDCL